jgi:endogenous inhibitor of DNA gyrase (YacG/DUF329 family)
MTEPPSLDPSAKPKPCPICGKPSSSQHRPFCSTRCADVDLHRWLGGHYVIPGRALAEDDEAEAAPPPRRTYDLGGN